MQFCVLYKPMVASKQACYISTEYDAVKNVSFYTNKQLNLQFWCQHYERFTRIHPSKSLDME